MPRLAGQVTALMPVPGPSTDFGRRMEKRRKAVMKRLRLVNYAVEKELAVLRYFKRLLRRRPNMPRSRLTFILKEVQTLQEVVHAYHTTITRCQRQLQHLKDRVALRQAELLGGNVAPVNINLQREDD